MPYHMQMLMPHSMSSMFPDGMPSKLDMRAIKKLKSDFLEAYPGEILDKSTTPGTKLLERVHFQAQEPQPFRWLPWDQVLSQEQEEELIRTKAKARLPSSDVGMLLQAMWEDQLRLPENQISGAPFFVSKLQAM